MCMRSTRGGRESNRARKGCGSTALRRPAVPMFVLLLAGVLAVIASSCGALGGGKPIEFEFCQATAPVEADQYGIRIVLKESSDITVTTYKYVGSRRLASSSPKLDYRPRQRLIEVFQAAGFRIITDDSSEPEVATLFADYRERKREAGLDAPTAYYLSYSLFHRSAGLIANGSTNSAGCDSSSELEADPAFAGLGETLSTALAEEDLEHVRVVISTRVPKPEKKPGIVATIPAEHDDIDHLVMSPDRRTVAYTARVGGERVVVRGAEVLDRYDTLIDRLDFHPNGQSLGYTVETGGARYAVIDGMAGCAFESAAGFQFSPDGMHYSMVARRGGKSFVIVDGREDPAFDSINTTAVFGPDGSYAYWAIDEKRIQLVQSGIPTATDWTAVTKPSYAPDGRLAYTARGDADDGWMLVIGEDREPLAVEGEVLAGPYFSSSGSQRALIVEKGDSSFISVDGHTPRHFKGGVTLPTFSEDGEHIAYRVREGNSEFVVVDGKESGRFDQVLGPIGLSADGSSVSFGARDGREVRLEVFDTVGLLGPRIREPVWKKESGTIDSSVPPVIDGGLVYVATKDSSVRAFDSETGEEVWSYKTSKYPVFPSFVVGEGLVVILHTYSGNRRAYAVDSKTGAELWQLQSRRSSWDTGPAIQQDRVFLISDGTLAAAGAKTGGWKWSKKIPGSGRGNLNAPIVAGPILLVASRNGILQAFNSKTGAGAWSRKLNGEGRVLGGPVYSDRIALLAYGKTLHAVDVLTGNDQWVVEDNSTILTPTLAGEQACFGTGAGEIRCVGIEDGAPLSRAKLGRNIPRLAVSGQVAYVAVQGDLRAIDIESGNELWRVESPWKKSSPPSISGGTIVFAAEGQLMAVREESVAAR